MVVAAFIIFSQTLIIWDKDTLSYCTIRNSGPSQSDIAGWCIYQLAYPGKV